MFGMVADIATNRIVFWFGFVERLDCLVKANVFMRLMTASITAPRELSPNTWISSIRKSFILSMIARLFFHLRVTISHFSYNSKQIEPFRNELSNITWLTGVVQMILAFWTNWNTFSSSWSVSPVNSTHLSLRKRSNLPLHSLNFSLQRALRGATSKS
jgi:succinate dehydrogenase/fumarate reductase cytochrome b subunit